MPKFSPPTKPSERACSRRAGLTALLSVCAALLPLSATADEADMPPEPKTPKKQKRRAKPAPLPTRGEEAEIESVLRELAYVRERVQSLERKYSRATAGAKIRFNYPALVAQLRTTEDDIASFLNARIDVITTRPPTPRQSTLFYVRPN